MGEVIIIAVNANSKVLSATSVERRDILHLCASQARVALNILSG